MTKPCWDKLKVIGLELPRICDVCGKVRSCGSHAKCSKIRQARYAEQRDQK